MIRMTPSNWARFESHGKQTTIRTHMLKFGVQECGSGSKQWGNWVPYPEKLEVGRCKVCKVSELTEADARNDGFDSLCELLLELGRLNKAITPDTVVWVHLCKKVKV